MQSQCEKDAGDQALAGLIDLIGTFDLDDNVILRSDPGGHLVLERLEAPFVAPQINAVEVRLRPIEKRR
jgi:hypothetical protein